MTDGRSRRRVLTCAGTTLAVGFAGCLGGDGTTADDDSGDADDSGDDGAPTETTGEQTESATTADPIPLTLSIQPPWGYQSQVVTVESLTFVAASADDDSPTLQIGKTVDLEDTGDNDEMVITDSLTVPTGTYESVEMTITPKEIVDSQGSSLDVSASTISYSLLGLENNEPTTIEAFWSQVEVTLNPYISSGAYRVRGGSFSGA